MRADGEYAPIPGRKVIDVIEQENFLIVPAGTTVTLITVQIGSGALLRLTHFCNFVRDPSTVGNIQWQMLYGNQPASPFDNVRTLNGEEGWMRYIASPRMVFPGGSNFTLTAISLNSGIDFYAGAKVRGEIYAR
jgi:hypothetical protein